MSRTVLSIAAEETTVTAGLEGGRGEAVIANRNEVYLLGWQKCSEIRYWWWLHYSEHTKNHRIFYFKKVCFMVHGLYVNKAVLKKKKKDDDDNGKKLRKCACKWALNVKYKNACLFPQFGFVCVSGQIHTKNCSVSQLCWVLSLRKSSLDSEGLPGWQMIKASTTCLTLWSFLLELAQLRYAHYHTYSFTSYGYFRRGVLHVALSR